MCSIHRNVIDTHSNEGNRQCIAEGKETEQISKSGRERAAYKYILKVRKNNRNLRNGETYLNMAGMEPLTDSFAKASEEKRHRRLGHRRRFLLLCRQKAQLECNEVRKKTLHISRLPFFFYSKHFRFGIEDYLRRFFSSLVGYVRMCCAFI